MRRRRTGLQRPRAARLASVENRAPPRAQLVADGLQHEGRLVFDPAARLGPEPLGGPRTCRHAGPSRPMFNRINLSLAVMEAAKTFHTRWRGILGLDYNPDTH
jgi:hypothetical protein